MDDHLSIETDRPVQAWYQDGLGEIAFGFLLVVLSGGLVIAQRPWAASFPFVWIFVPVLLAGGLSRWLVARWKASVTIPRIGYVEPALPTTGRRRTAYLLTLGVAAMSAFAVIAQGSWEAGRLLLPISSLVLAATCVHAALRWSMPRYFALAAIPCLFGLWAYYSEAGVRALPWLFFALGVAFGTVGGVRLLRFLVMHPLQDGRSS
jgi:hypothetical protein